MSDFIGRAVVDGVLQYTSPSAISKAVHPKEGCWRQWAFRYVLGIKPDSSPAQERGIAGHGRIEHHLRTGDEVLSDWERAGRVWIPSARDSVIVEPKFNLDDPIATLAGIPLIGKLDAFDFSGRYVDPEGEVHAQDFPEIDDWKFSGDPRKWGMSADKIREDLAMNTYALWAWQRVPAAERVRLSHVYFCTRKPDAFKRTAVVDRAHSLRVVGAYEPAIEKMQLAAACSDPNDLEPNYDACDAFRGCPYQSRCNRPLEAVVRMKLGVNRPALVPATEENLMSMLEQMTGGQPATNTNAQPADTMEDRLAKLEQAEAAAGASPTPPPPTPPPRDVDKMLRTVRSYGIGTPAFGGVAATECARVYRWDDFKLGSGIAGSGGLGKLTVSTLDQFDGLLAELATKFPDPARAAEQLAAAKGLPAAPADVPPAPADVPATPPPDVPSALPPRATLPPPHEAADGLLPEQLLDLSVPVRAAVEEHAAQVAAAAPPPSADAAPKGRPAGDLPAARFKKEKKAFAVEKALALMAACGLTDVDAIDSFSLPGDGVPPSDQRVDELERQLAESRKREQAWADSYQNAPPSDQRVVELERQLAESRKREQAWADSYQTADRAAEDVTSGPDTELWVDCLPSDLSAVPLDDYVDAACIKVAEVGGSVHILCAEEKSPIAFGKWRGYLDAHVRHSPPTPGRYYVRSGGDEIREVIVNALRQHHGVRVHRGIA